MITVLWCTSYRRAQGHWREAQRLESSGRFDRAAQHYQWAARSYYPMSGIGERSLYQLWRLSEYHQAEGQQIKALYCLDLLRGAVWSTRWLRTPYLEWRDRTDQMIAQLRVQSIEGVEENKSAISTQLMALSDDPRPSPERSLALLLSVLAVCVSVASLFLRGLTTDLRPTPYTRRCMLALSFSSLSFFITLGL